MIDPNKAPHVPNSKPVTKRDFALGALGKPDYRGDYSEMRYMTHDEVVSFEVFNKKSDFNWEFNLNADKTRKIWFSQLNGLYLSGEGEEISSCVVITKGDGVKHIALMSPSEFWKEVQGKRYKVEVDNDKYVIDRWHAKCAGRTAGDIAKEIYKALSEERYSDVKGMTKPQTLYILKEV